MDYLELFEDFLSFLQKTKTDGSPQSRKQSVIVYTQISSKQINRW